MGRYRVAAVAGAILLAVSRVLARPRTFWEWDDYIFGLSLHTFAPQASVPQAPFFPAFVFLARLVRLALGDDVLALTWLSVGASCAALVFLYGLVVELFGSRSLAVDAVVLFAFFPAVWFSAGIPITDTAGVAAALLAFWLAVRSWSRPRELPLACLAFGLACGIRPQTAAAALAPLLVGFARKRRAPRLFGLAAAAGALAVFWFLPVLVAAGGWAPVRAMVEERWRYNVSSTASFARPTSVRFLAERWLLAPWVSPTLALVVLALTIAGAALLWKRPTQSIVLLLAAGFGPCAAVSWLLLDPLFAGRYVLAWLPAQAILVAYAASRLEARVGLSRLKPVTVALVVWGFVLVEPALRILHTRPAPPEEAASALRMEIQDRPYAILHPHELYVHSELLFPGAPKYESEKVTAAELRRLRPGVPVYRFGVASLSDPGRTACWPPLRPFTSIGTGRYLDVPFGPLSRLEPTFGEGWFPEESEPGPDCGRRIFRWMGPRGRVTLPAIPGAWDLDLELRAPLALLPSPPSVSLSLNGTVLARLDLRGERYAGRLPIPESASKADAENEIVIATSSVFVPAKRGGSDERELGLQLTRLTVIER